MSMFKKAERKRIKMKFAITGASGSGKTYSALELAEGMVKASGTSGRIAVIDTENGSASLYARSDAEKDKTSWEPGKKRFDFDTIEISPPYSHEKFIAAINAAVKEGYYVVIIDSASHFWEGILKYKSDLDDRPGNRGNSYTNWNQAGEKFKDILAAVLQSDIHVICCMRSKMDYILEEQTSKDGRKINVPKKVGMAPIMRDNIEYEFSTVFDLSMNNTAFTSKDRTGLFHDSTFKISEKEGMQIHNWLMDAKESDTKQVTIKQTMMIEDAVNQIQICSDMDQLNDLRASLRNRYTWSAEDMSILKEAVSEKVSLLMSDDN